MILLKLLNKASVVNNMDQKAKACGAVVMAEDAMKQKAINEFRQFVEGYCADSGKKDIPKESEHYVNVLNELINK